MFTPYTGMPGVGTAVTATPREIFAGNANFQQYVPGMFIIDGTKARDVLNVDAVTAATQYDVLRCGVLMGKITSGGKYANSVIGVSGSAVTTGSTTLTVTAAVGAEIVRRIGASGTFKLVGPPAANGTAASQTITYSGVSGTTVTISNPGAASVSGSLITPTDGSETILTIVGDKYGVKVTDSSGNGTDVAEGQFTLAGHVNSANIVNWPTDTGIQAYIKTALKAAGSYTFNDVF